ncbi:MAG: transporter substrate-binding domain-containing protein [Pseudodesulfovibrio sp.]
MKHFFACICVILLAAPCMAGEKVVLVSNEYMPYVNTSPNKRGFVTEAIVAAFAEVGVETEIQFRPWRRCAMLVEDGKVFGAFPYGVTTKRKAYAWFSDPVTECRNVFFYMKGRKANFDFTTLEAMQGYSIAGTSGNYYEDIFAETGLMVDYAPGEASGIRKVWEMRSEFFAEDELVGWSLISRLFPNSMHMFGSTPTAWNVNPQTIMVSKKYPGAKELMAKFNTGLQTIRENGVFDEIFNRYMDGCPVKRP